MRKHTILAILIFLNINLFAQVQIEENENYIKTYSISPTIHRGYLVKLNTRNGQICQIDLNHKKTNQFEIPATSLPLVEKTNEVDNRFKLFPADHYNFLLLDQINGRIWQYTWDIRLEKNKISPINNSTLIEEKKIKENRFTLYPTIDSRYFLLLDKINGKLWQLNWSVKTDKSEFIPIQ